MAIVSTTIDEDIWEDVWDEERTWREERPEKEQVPDPLALVIFGATGDLTHRKLVPALYSMQAGQLLPEKFSIVGFGRSEQDQDRFRQGLRESVEGSGTKVDPRIWDEFARKITYVRGRYDDEE